VTIHYCDVTSPYLWEHVMVLRRLTITNDYCRQSSEPTAHFYCKYILSSTTTYTVEEASTHKSANTHADNVFVTLILWPHNKWFSRNISMSSLGILAASAFGVSCGKTDTAKRRQNPTPATAVGVGNSVRSSVN